MRKRIIPGFLILIVTIFCLTFAQAGAPAASVGEVRTEIGENAVAYPQLQGMADDTVQKKINDDIVLSSGVTGHLITLSTLKDSPWGLQVEYTAYQEGDVFSTVISAKGKMPEGREGHTYTALAYDLKTGERLTVADLFSDVEAAVAHMEQLAEETLSDELSGYMEHSDLLPLPVEAFAVDQDGVTFYYPAKQFSLLSGYSGACQFYYEELAEFLRSDDAGIPARIGVPAKTWADAEAEALIEQSVRDGVLPHVPVKLGDNMGELAAKFRLLRTPDEFPGGRYFLMEAPAFRQVLLISDAIESGYERSVLEGIQLKRGSLYGLSIGLAKQSEWRGLLGKPDETIGFTENMAYDYNLPIGQSDLYRFGDYELRLHADEGGVLRAIQLGK